MRGRTWTLPQNMTKHQEIFTEHVLTPQQLAWLAGVSPARISQMKKEAFPPPANDDGQFPIVAAGAWLREFAVRRVRGDVKGDPKLDANMQLARKNAALADKTELENAQRRGELIEADSVKAEWETILMRVRTKLLQIPSMAAPVVSIETDPVEIQKIIDDHIRDALSELANDADNEEPE